MPRPTGFTAADAQDDFLRARRRQAAGRLGRRLRFDRGDVEAILPFDEVIVALGRLGEHDRGVEVIDLDTVVGTVDRGRGFDRAFRPTSPEVRGRWERIAELMRRGAPLPPIQVYRIGEAHFVRDGHHRVSVARALGLRVLDAHVVEVRTRVGADRNLRVADLPVKSHERLFAERVPLPADVRPGVRPSAPEGWGELAEGVEAWGFRAMQDRGELLGREQVARAWYEEEFAPVAAMLAEAGATPEGVSAADAYLAIGSARYRLLGTQEWSPEVLARVLAERRR